MRPQTTIRISFISWSDGGKVTNKNKKIHFDARRYTWKIESAIVLLELWTCALRTAWSVNFLTPKLGNYFYISWKWIFHYSFDANQSSVQRFNMSFFDCLIIVISSPFFVVVYYYFNTLNGSQREPKRNYSKKVKRKEKNGMEKNKIKHKFISNKCVWLRSSFRTAFAHDLPHFDVNATLFGYYLLLL